MCLLQRTIEPRLLVAVAGRADYFGLVLNRSARVQGAAHGGQVLAEGLAMDKIAQEWRVLYQQKPTARSGKGPKYLPGKPIGCLCC
jgi:class 3 adenylate cyclase